jgi:transposase
MLNEELSIKVYLASGYVDMRKSIDGLAAIVQEEFQLNPFSSCLFVFCNRSKDKIKILRWDTNGFWLYYKRLEKQRFRWPSTKEHKTVSISSKELHWLLDGLDITTVKAHKTLDYRHVV